MNLNGLREQLPTEVDLEKELANQFRAAALSITGLFQQGKKLSKKGKHSSHSHHLTDTWAGSSEGKRERDRVKKTGEEKTWIPRFAC